MGRQGQTGQCIRPVAGLGMDPVSSFPVEPSIHLGTVCINWINIQNCDTGAGKCPVLWILTLVVLLPVACCVLSSAKFCLSGTWLAQGQQRQSLSWFQLGVGVLLGGSRVLELLPGSQAVPGKGFLHLLFPHVRYLLLGRSSPTAAGGHVWVAPNKPWSSLPLSSAQGKGSSRLKWEATPVL